MLNRLAVVVAALLGFAGTAFAEDLKLDDGQGLPEGMKLRDGVIAVVEKVTKVSDAGFVVDVHTITLVADGEVRGEGWSDARLEWIDEVQIPENADKYLDMVFSAVPPTPPPTSGGTVAISSNRTSSQEEIANSEGVRVWSKTNCIQRTWAGVITEMKLEDCRAAATTRTAQEPPQLKVLGLDLDKPLLIPTLTAVTMAPFSTEMDGRIGVRVTGATPTLDWADPHLLLIDNKDSSADKYIDVAFLIVPPNGETGFEVATHKAERSFLKDEQGATIGVRVWAENGCIEMPWNGDSASTVVPFADCVAKAGLVPRP